MTDGLWLGLRRIRHDMRWHEPGPVTDWPLARGLVPSEQHLVGIPTPARCGRGLPGSRQALLDNAHLLALGPAPTAARVDDLEPGDLMIISKDIHTDSQRGGDHLRKAALGGCLQTCKLCGVDPQAYLTDVLSRIATGHLNTQIDDLLPWAYPTTPGLKAVA